MSFYIWLIAIGLFIWFLKVGLFNFFVWSRDWPLILVLIGVLGVISYIISFFKKKAKNKVNFKEKINKILKDLEEGKITYEEAIKLIKNVE